MQYHVLPTLPDPPHDHEMAHDTPDYQVSPDIGTGGAGFFVACLVLIVTLSMGILAIGQIQGGDGLMARHFERAVDTHMQSPDSRATRASFR